MDPISHALFAKTLHALDERGRFGPGAAAAFVAGSLLPDVDIVRVIQGWDVYLARHEVETHTLLATPIEGAALALVLYRFLRARGRAARLFPLALAATIGAITHVFLDLANGSDMKIFHPVADLRMGWHLMAMWEPVVVSGLVLTHLLAWRHPRLRQRLAGVFLAVFAVFLFAKAGSQRLALAGRDADRGELMRVEEVRGSFSRWRWFVRERESGRYEVYDARAFGGAPRLAFTRDPGGSNETITATLEYPVVRHLHAIGDMPLVWMEAGAHPGDRHVLVHWSDMEFCGPDRCFMTFGVAFDGEGTPLYQFVDVGGLRQRRAAARHERFALSSIE